MCTREAWIPPAAGLRSWVYPAAASVSQSPHFLAPESRSPWGCSSTLTAGTDTSHSPVSLSPIEIPRLHSVSSTRLKLLSNNQFLPWPHLQTHSYPLASLAPGHLPASPACPSEHSHTHSQTYTAFRCWHRHHSDHWSDSICWHFESHRHTYAEETVLYPWK